MTVAQKRTHVVKAGETLYRLSVNYKVTVEAIQKANPSIKGTNLPAGMTVVIPDSPLQQTPSVTIQTPGEKMRQQQQEAERRRNQPASVAKTWSVPGEGHWSDGVLNIAVLLPFNLEASTLSENKTQMRSVEFYEGVLLAVDEMQQNTRRLRYQVQAHDISSQPLSSLLYAGSMDEADVVIAPMDEEDVRAVAEWSDVRGTPVVSPFSFNSDMVRNHQHLFQINSQKSMLYGSLTQELLRRFEDYTVVFLTDKNSEKTDPYPAHLKTALQQKGGKFRELSYANAETLMACDSVMGLMDDNILFVPVTSHSDAMRRMFSGLQHVKILRETRRQLAIDEGRTPKPLPKLAVLGYPEWALNTSDFIHYYYDLDVYMFTKVYANPFDPDLKSFYSTFKRWYGKEPMSLTPKYALLGYDVAKYFLSLLTRNGRNLEQRVSEQPEDGVQTNFCFRSNYGEGFCNQGFYLVHFTPESTIEKITVQ